MRVTADDPAGLTIADVMHGEFATMAPSVTVGEARDWFAVSVSRRLALIADGERYAGSLTPADLAREPRRDRPALELARRGRTLAPDAPATSGRDAVLETDARRLPVVDGDDRLVGVLALTTDARFFSCRDEKP